MHATRVTVCSASPTGLVLAATKSYLVQAAAHVVVELDLLARKAQFLKTSVGSV